MKNAQMSILHFRFTLFYLEYLVKYELPVPTNQLLQFLQNREKYNCQSAFLCERIMMRVVTPRVNLPIRHVTASLYKRK